VHTPLTSLKVWLAALVVTTTAMAQCPPKLPQPHKIFRLFFDGIWFVEGIGDTERYIMNTFATYEVIDSQLQVEGHWSVVSKINTVSTYRFRQVVSIPYPWKAKQGLNVDSGVCVEGHFAIVVHSHKGEGTEVPINWCVELLPAGDINEDGRVDSTDSGLLFADWGTNAQRSDINRDGAVNGDDLGLLYTQWTK
jgi:hypothetical protein